MTHYIKVREIGKKQWKFLARDGVTRLRIHAIRLTEFQANALIADNRDDNPEWEWKTALAGRAQMRTDTEPTKGNQ